MVCLQEQRPAKYTVDGLGTAAFMIFKTLLRLD